VQENRSPAHDALKWFGILVPSSLHQAQLFQGKRADSRNANSAKRPSPSCFKEKGP